MVKGIIDTLKKEKVVAVIRTNSYEEAKEISIGAIEGGVKVIEVTMSVPNSEKLIKELKETYTNILVGAGTVLTKDQLNLCMENKADFIVSPCLSEDVIMESKNCKVPIIPGVMTMSELNSAYSKGIRFFKVFPGNVVGKDFIKAAKSIFSDIDIMPTGGVNNENILDWINAGADCIGIGSDLNKVFKNFGKNGVIEYCKNLI
ncbi:bifunctional 4-hydroxy-2-oxoglutarate aldolase/2-dehydro-3-deoxy-phosphogluconate aldolase [Clostridium baratii]|uniref:bifunctional 4-hydroxy-2-oxoglutarate aldolase/2-dehydro-3-deoxy-phosphogluconate aldolase n=1 Tax=Clostridium baratii TaxID=1561 RepID=UPI00097FA8E3|nr:bifunctional 4-hydroxy-2-oxoglutarate aldolase/2-dehydro-3-deoxy-phosphogluconate aldolase [Clostridium baratii]AQM59639.1 2-dehydro-3-deoxyphosphogluconate aldolase [Clostridium baratii]